MQNKAHSEPGQGLTEDELIEAYAWLEDLTWGGERPYWARQLLKLCRHLQQERAKHEPLLAAAEAYRVSCAAYEADKVNWDVVPGSGGGIREGTADWSLMYANMGAIDNLLAIARTESAAAPTPEVTE